MRRIVEGMEISQERMEENAGGLTLATDLANYLVLKGVPFRKAHRIVGSLVSYLLERKKRLEEVTLSELRSFSEHFSEDVLKLIDPRHAADRRTTYGGTSRREILRMLEIAKREEGI